MKKWLLALSLLTLTLTAVGFYAYKKITTRPRNVSAPVADVLRKDAYASRIQPLFDARCVACHSCFNSPCQLDLTSWEGARRGGSTLNVYDFPLLEARPPTRLGIDATSEAEWRKKGFHTVLNPEKPGPALLVELSDPAKPGKQDSYDSYTARTCPDSADADKLQTYFKANPGGRMPFGLPPLSTAEHRTLREWVREGAVGPSPEAHRALREPAAERGAAVLREWEDYFNRDGLREQLVSRYLYEHLFTGHLRLAGLPGETYRLVRARARDGAIEEVATVRPYDDAGKFAYRLQRYTRTPVMKTVLPYVLDEGRRRRWDELFLSGEWSIDKMPPFGPAGANAFATFRAMPAEGRYRFLLDDAYYFVGAFIKGPVCRGQTALNVINDHFWVMFVDPAVDQSARDEKLIARMAPLMNPPASREDQITLFKNFRKGYWEALHHKYAAYKAAHFNFSPEAIWDGDGWNPSALLTVYRHFDNAQVLKGAWGEEPRTVWVMDYQVFEDIYYNLVAGYDVFGPLIHQINTRLYMDLSRIASEDMFLNYLPQRERAPLRASWYREVPAKKESFGKEVLDLFGESTKTLSSRKYPYLGTALVSTFDASKTAFLDELWNHRFKPRVRGPRDPINRQGADEAGWRASVAGDISVYHILEGIAARRGEFLQWFPDTALLRVRGGSHDRVFTIVRNKEHLNVSLILFEDERRAPAEDTLNVIPGFATAYPSLYLDVSRRALKHLVRDLALVKSEGDWRAWMKNYAVDRHAENFWPLHDFFNRDNLEHNLEDPGYLDLNRYGVQ